MCDVLLERRGEIHASHSCRRTVSCGTRAVPARAGLCGLPDRFAHPGGEPTRLGQRCARTGPARRTPEGMAVTAPRDGRATRRLLRLEKMAEREGFEPSTHLSARTRFPVALLRPLGHLSADAH